MSLATQPGHTEVTRSASPDNMNALEASETSDSGPTVAETEKKGNDLAGGRKESKVVSLADDREAGEGEEGRTARRRSRQGTRDTTRSENPSLARRFTDLFVSEHPIKHEPTWRASALAIVKASWLNILLVFIPVSSLNSSSVRDETNRFESHRLDGLFTLLISTTPLSSSSSEYLFPSLRRRELMDRFLV